jgi:hypothetical protein
MKDARASFLLVCGLVATAAVVFADLKKGDYAPAQLGAIQQPAPLPILPDTSYAVGAYPVPEVALAPGDGLQDVRIYCGTCHSPRYITMQPPLPSAAWEAEVNKMNKTFGEAIPEDSARKIILYLQSHYTPETRKQ